MNDHPMSDPETHILKSRIGNLRKYLPDAKLSLYAMCDRSFQTFCMVGIATCAEQMLDLCHEAGLHDWTLGNTNCRSIIRNVDEEGPRLLTVVTLRKNDRARPVAMPVPLDNGFAPTDTSSNERTRKRKERRKRALLLKKYGNGTGGEVVTHENKAAT